MRRFSLCLLSLFAALSAAQAQEKEEPISPERPSFTNGTDTVPVGHTQFESGYTRSYDHGDRENTLGDGTQLRVPIRSNWEARFGLPAYLWERGSGPVDGFGDASISMKYRFRDAEAARKAFPALAFIAGLELPTGKGAFREDDYQPSLALEADWKLAERYSLTADTVYNAVRSNGQRYDEWGGGICLNITLSPLWETFGEIYRVSDTGTGETHDNFVDTGLVYRVGANTAIDINTGFGVFGTRSQWFIGGGIARRW